MVDVSAVAGTVSALKGAMGISKALIGLRDTQVVQSEVIVNLACAAARSAISRSD